MWSSRSPASPLFVGAVAGSRIDDLATDRPLARWRGDASVRLGSEAGGVRVTFGLTIEKILLIGLIAVMIIGPYRLPAAAESLRRTIQHVRRMARTAQKRVRDELGPEVADVDWQRLDPRQYDPRRIIREALLADSDAPPEPGTTAAAPRAADEPAAAAAPPAPLRAKAEAPSEPLPAAADSDGSESAGADSPRRAAPRPSVEDDRPADGADPSDHPK